MAQLHVEVTSPSMPGSTQFIRFCKAVEQFYYVLTIAWEPDSAKAAAAWRAWLANGLHPAVRLAPPVDAAKRIRVDSRPGVGGFELTAAGPNREALARLQKLLQAIDAAHKAIAESADDAARAASLIATQAVVRELVQPLKDCAARGLIPPAAVDSFMAMIGRGVAAIGAREITGLAVSLT